MAGVKGNRGGYQRSRIVNFIEDKRAIDRLIRELRQKIKDQAWDIRALKVELYCERAYREKFFEQHPHLRDVAPSRLGRRARRVKHDLAADLISDCG